MCWTLISRRLTARCWARGRLLHAVVTHGAVGADSAVRGQRAGSPFYDRAGAETGVGADVRGVPSMLRVWMHKSKDFLM